MSIPTVLAIDDSLVMHQLIKRALEPDYDVLTTDNPIDALTMLYHNHVDAVLLDVSMPTIDGLEVCRTIRNLPQFHHLPVVMVTARDSSFDRVQGYLAGTSEYLTKPFDANQLRQTVQRLIDKVSVSSTAAPDAPAKTV